MKTYERIIGIPGVKNLGIVEKDLIYRSAQPHDYNKLAPLGLKSILYLGDDSHQEEVEFAGLKYISFRINVLTITTDDFNLLLKQMVILENLPMLVQCLQGHDRTGVTCAAYRIIISGWNLNEAWEEAEQYGFNPMWFGLKKHLEDYIKIKKPGAFK